MKNINLVICNPSNAKGSVNINFHTNIKYNQSFVLYTTLDDYNWNNARIISTLGKYCDVFNNVISVDENRCEIVQNIIFNNYQVTIDNLKLNTKFKYKIFCQEFSETYYFKTESEEFSFLLVSDFHTYNPLKARLDSALSISKNVIEKENGVDFILCGGDCVAWGGSYDFWESLFNSFLVKEYMFVNILGNHDYMSRGNLKNTQNYFLSVNNNPHNSYPGQMGATYFFTYGCCLFIILNNEAMGFLETSEEIEKTKKWLIDVLKNNTKKFIIVCQHYEWFQGITGADRIWGNLRFKDIFDEYNVDLALGNNNHIYVRTKPIYKNSGTTYIQAPSSDNERGQEMGELIYNKDIIASRFTEGSRTVGALYIKVLVDKIEIKLYNRYKEIVDSVIIKSKE